MKSKYKLNDQVRSTVNDSVKEGYTVTRVYPDGRIDVTTNTRDQNTYTLDLDDQDRVLAFMEE